MMRFDRPRCPACRRPARGLLATLTTHVELAPLPDGGFAPRGRRVLPASEKPVSVEGRWVLACACGELWLAWRLEEDEARTGSPVELPPPALAGAQAAEPVARSAGTERSPAHAELRRRFQAHLAELRRARRLVPPDPPPRYDEVFFRGLAWLDRQ